MSQYLTDVTAVSSKGQIVLPKPIRDTLSLVSGARLMVMCDGENILLKPIRKPDISEFRAMMDQAANWASEAGMTEEDIGDAIREVRNAGKDRA
jgi:antitoxin PrlF